ncbi:MAG: alpha-amylase [Prevotellaceae bacterium]|jgi:glycosidase|nr:alpha-amylase [Prevotellaceae bacterium]
MSEKKIIIYQVMPRWFGGEAGKFNDFTEKALHEIAALGITHVWYTGIIAHATPAAFPEIVKGSAGSPYAVADYYDVAASLASKPEVRMSEFEALLRRTRQAGMQVIIDFVPNHVARAYHSEEKPYGVRDFGDGDDPTKQFSPENDFYYLTDDFVPPAGTQRYTEQPARATGNDCFTAHPSANDWYDTVKLNYGVDVQHGCATHFSPIPGVWKKMRDVLLFWAAKDIDGFRCDMAEMVSSAFWNWVVPQVKAVNPDIIFIAEIYNPDAYRNYLSDGKFDYLYDKVGLYDTLRGVICCGQPSSAITRCWQCVEGIGRNMLHFLENHDEQRIASRFFAGDAHKALPAMLVSAAMNQGAVMIYAGQEVGETADDAAGSENGRTSIFDYTNVPTLQQWRNGGRFDGGRLHPAQKQLRSDYSTLLNVVRQSDAIAQGAFYDLMWANAGRPFMERCYLFLRHTTHEILLFVSYFDAPEAELRIHIPAHALDTMGLPRGKSRLLTPLLHHTTPVELSVDSEITLTVKDFAYEIFRLSEK